MIYEKYYITTLQKERARLELRSHGIRESRIGRSRLTARSSKLYNITTTLHFEDNRQQTTDNGGRQPACSLVVL